MNYISPGSQNNSFIEEAALFGARVAAGMAVIAVSYWFALECVKAF